MILGSLHTRRCEEEFQNCDERLGVTVLLSERRAFICRQGKMAGDSTRRGGREPRERRNTGRKEEGKMDGTTGGDGQMDEDERERERERQRS